MNLVKFQGTVESLVPAQTKAGKAYTALNLLTTYTDYQNNSIGVTVKFWGNKRDALDTVQVGAFVNVTAKLSSYKNQEGIYVTNYNGHEVRQGAAPQPSTAYDLPKQDGYENVEEIPF